jgi:hypothetical protein
MYFQIYKGRLLTADFDGAYWHVLLDEGYRTGNYATPQEALEEAITWIDAKRP